MQTEFVERRSTRRINAGGETKYKIASAKANGIKSNYESGKIKNISKGGICLLLTGKIEEGTTLRVEINLTNPENRMISAFCEVEWCNPAGPQDLYEIGLSFFAVKEEDQKFLDGL